MSQTTRILLSLVAGLAIGIVAAATVPESAISAIDYVRPIGSAWLNALRMTIVPLVVSLLVVGIAATAEAARASKLATGAIALFLVLLWISAALGALLTPLFLDLWTLPDSATAALRDAFAGAEPAGEVPPFSDFLAAIVPTNPIAAAAEDSFLPLIIFTTVFAFAVTRLPEEPRETLVKFFRALSDAMLVMIHWVLWLAPIGVVALSYVVGARAGTAALGALLHYVVIVSAVGGVLLLLAYPLAVFGGKLPLGRFAREVAPSQAVAVSTQSSLASLPAMLASSERLGIPVSTSGVTLPLAVAIFRVTGPCMNIAVAIYVAHVFGMELTPTQLAAGVAAAAITTLGAVSLPGAISFISSIAPVAIAMGVPVAPLALLVAVETLPDIMRTIANVTMDVSTTSVIAARSGAGGERSEADELLEG
ncbi:dicarboxylate/amino acid:cation symporter [Stakelama tenebrarum]|uniref:Dicarboxylate/amino acid:cation symporter n=1 Tax=Stakelama tenebrarum TaxID=2711215 RepID=A0A6G6Y9J5_9SPHN|nr:cation:dicarboxylase symporter family transporter [Sphingosinithalassobacter tenebrarum]QIG81612.1 dicarboxylate/amino acid:cation symporter [Sphingosinithalassobacter tenebrarum]